MSYFFSVLLHGLLLPPVLEGQAAQFQGNFDKITKSQIKMMQNCFSGAEEELEQPGDQPAEPQRENA